MLLKNVRLAAQALVTVVLLAMVDGVFAQNAAPTDPAGIALEGIKDEKKPSEQKDAGKTVKQKDMAALPQIEVLCKRVQFIKGALTDLEGWFNGELTTEEGKKAPDNYYGLSSVTVPQGGWKIHAVAIYTRASQPKEWLKLRRARLNVFPKKADRPAAVEDPRQGREVEVTVREIRKGVHEVQAADLKLSLEPGEYWLGLTPIYSASNGSGSHLLASRVRDEGECCRQ